MRDSPRNVAHQGREIVHRLVETMSGITSSSAKMLEIMQFEERSNRFVFREVTFPASGGRAEVSQDNPSRPIATCCWRPLKVVAARRPRSFLIPCRLRRSRQLRHMRNPPRPRTQDRNSQSDSALPARLTVTTPASPPAIRFSCDSSPNDWLVCRPSAGALPWEAMIWPEGALRFEQLLFEMLVGNEPELRDLRSSRSFAATDPYCAELRRRCRLRIPSRCARSSTQEATSTDGCSMKFFIG
jgi:hypothetical protein